MPRCIETCRGRFGEGSAKKTEMKARHHCSFPRKCTDEWQGGSAELIQHQARKSEGKSLLRGVVSGLIQLSRLQTVYNLTLTINLLVSYTEPREK